MPLGDHPRLEQPQVVAGKVEDLGNRRNIGGSVQVDAGQANDRLVDDAEPCLDWRPGLCRALARRRGRRDRWRH